MKTLALSFLPLLCLVACADSPFVGTWAVDVESTVSKRAEEVEGLSEDDKGLLREQLGSSHASIDLQAGGNFTMHFDTPQGEHQHRHGTWETEGDTVSLTFAAEGRQPEYTRVFRVSGDAMTETSPDVDVRMVFTRR